MSSTVLKIVGKCALLPLPAVFSLLVFLLLTTFYLLPTRVLAADWHYYTGNVGIGKVPTTQLDVLGTVTATAFVGSFTGGAFNVGYVSPGTFGSSTTKGNYRFDASSSTNPVLFVDATNERVGIGTAGPGQKLEVYGANVADVRLRLNHLNVAGNTYYNGEVYQAANNLTIRSMGDAVTQTDGTRNGSILFKTNDRVSGTLTEYDAMYIKSNGNVGIGTTNPLSKLQVAAASGDTTGQLRINNAGSWATNDVLGIDFRIQDSLQAFVRAIVTNSPSAATELAFGTANGGNLGTEAMRINRLGNVGIGTTSPGYKLDVNGTANVSGTFNVTGDVTLAKTITATGTTGNQTINKTTGRVNFAAAAQSLTVTCNLVTANSIIICTVATDDATANSCKAIPGSGSFTLKLNAAATAETAVCFHVTN